MGKVRQLVGNVRGPKGVVFTPHISPSLDLSFTNDGDLPNPATVNLKPAPATTSSDGLMSAADKSKVDGLAALAYKSEVSVSDLAAALKAAIDAKAETSALTALIGGDAGKTVRAIANEELASQLIPENAQASLDTLQELAAWFQEHPNEVAAINRKLTLGTNNGSEYATVKAYVEAMVSGLITLSSLSAAVSGNGNAVTGVSYDSATGAFSFNKGSTFLTQHQDISGKVDKIVGKGLSTNDYTTAEKNKLLSVEAGAQVNEVTSEDFRSMTALMNVVRFQVSGFQKQFEQFRAVFDNFLYAQGLPCYMTAVGTGVIDIQDAAAGQIHSITVDSSLSGQRLYVQLSNGAGLTDTTVTVNSDGMASVSLATRKGRNRLYITTSAYTFPPGTNGGHGPHTGGTYVNSHKDENGQWAYDCWIPNHGVEATVRYSQDTALGNEIAKEIDYDEFLAMLGLSVTYSVTSNPAAVQSAGKELYMKMEGYPFGTQAKPTYAKTSYPNALCSVYYVAEYQNFGT